MYEDLKRYLGKPRPCLLCNKDNKKYGQEITYLKQLNAGIVV